MPTDLPPSLTYTPTTVRLIAEAQHALGELSGIGRLFPNPELLIRPYETREAMLSSRIEGIQTTYDELYLFDPNTSFHADSRDGETQEVHNYIRALRHGIGLLEQLPLSLRLVRSVHEVLMQGARGQHSAPGEFRRIQNHIGRPGSQLRNATYVPPPPNELIRLLTSWETFLHQETQLPLLVQCALIHYQFEAIHPFLDGNGRVGRLFIILFLMGKGALSQPLLYLSSFFERYRRDYYELLAGVGERGEWVEWIEFFLRGVRSQANDAVLRADRLSALHRLYQERVSNASARSKATPLVDTLFATPVVTASFVAERHEVTWQTAQNWCEYFVGLGILRHFGEKRPRAYAAWELLDLIERDEMAPE